MTPSLRRAGREDARALADVQQASSLAGLAHVFPPERYPYPVEAVRERWAGFTARGGWATIAEHEGEPVGFGAIDPPWLESLYVVPAAWGSGVAAALHDAAVEALAATGARRARLWVLEDNPRARRFYERRGWKLDGTTRVVPFPPNPLDVGYALDLRGLFVRPRPGL